MGTFEKEIERLMEAVVIAEGKAYHVRYTGAEIKDRIRIRTKLLATYLVAQFERDEERIS